VAVVVTSVARPQTLAAARRDFYIAWQAVDGCGAAQAEMGELHQPLRDSIKQPAAALDC